jgi:hypothetical protein
MIRHDIHLLVHPDMEVDVWQFVDPARGRVKKAKRQKHILLRASSVDSVEKILSKSFLQLSGRGEIF